MSAFGFLATTTNDNYSVPFGIQLFAIILAPGLALFGLVFGASLSSRQENRKWLRDERQQAYLEFLVAVRHWGHRCFVHISGAFTTSDPDIVIAAATNPENDEPYNELLRKYDRLRLVAAMDVLPAAEKVFSLSRQMADMVNNRENTARAHTRDPDIPYEVRGKEWSQTVTNLFDLVDEFVAVAHRSLRKPV
jgi:hypothetical protein